MMRDMEEQDIWDVKKNLLNCAESHPKAQVVDYIKRLYQAEFGGGHMIEDENASLERLRQEISGLTERQRQQPYFDPFCSPFCRLNLSASKEASPELINRIFVVSAQEVPKTAWFRFEEKMKIFWDLCREQNEVFPFTVEEAREYLQEYRKNGYGPVSHSEIYRKTYEPAYRIIRKEYARFLPLYAAIEECLKEKGSVNIAIDGNSGAGKTEAARLLANLFDCNVFHADDYFLPLEKRTPERMDEVGGNMERERFRQEIHEKVREGKPFSYRPFNCTVMKLGEPVEVQPKKINVFEGSYSMHPELREYYDIAVFLSVSSTEQEARILERNGSFMLRRFLDEWIPKENDYFEKMKVREACQFVF